MAAGYASFTVLFLGGCGTYVPQVAEVLDQPNGALDATGVLEKNIKQRIYCELKQAVIDSKRIRSNRDGKDVDALPDSWGVQMTINLTIDETGALNPGATLIQTFPTEVLNFPNKVPVSAPQSFNLGFGGTLSSQATRIDKYSFYYSVGALKVSLGAADTSCDVSRVGSSPFITSELGISQWLIDALTLENFYPSSPPPPPPPKQRASPPAGGGGNSDSGGGSKQDVLSYEIKFIIITSGNVTPTWKLVRVSANTGNASFASLNRTRTHDLLITFGPSNGNSQPGPLASNSHLSSEIAGSLSTTLKSLLPAQ
jgi:hypothetical protein